jgi:deoxyribose-phosphate aldolase
MDRDVVDARRALDLLDLTDLGDHPTPEGIDRLCDRAMGPEGTTAAVCVWPRFVGQCVRRLRGSGVLVATVVNFPDGGDDLAAVAAETRQAVRDGADEIDLVLPYRSFLAGDVASTAAVLDGVRHLVVEQRRMKVILESGGYPTIDQVHAAARMAIEHGADFVKTSTGKTAVSATDEAVVAILEEIRSSGRPVGVKPSGGISSLADAQRFLAHADRIMGPQWATRATFRFGASGLLDVLLAVIAGVGDHAHSGTY